MENMNHPMDIWDQILIVAPEVVYAVLVLFAYYCAFNLYRKLCKVFDSLCRYLDSHAKKE